MGDQQISNSADAPPRHQWRLQILPVKKKNSSNNFPCTANKNCEPYQAITAVAPQQQVIKMTTREPDVANTGSKVIMWLLYKYC